MSATARSVNDDPYQNFRFHVYDSGGILNVTNPSGGFSSVSVPELNIDMGEYREGLWIYSQKFPIRPHFTPLSLHKGVMRNDSVLYKVAKSAVEGKLYRTDIIIKQFHRTDVTGLINYKNSSASREIRAYNCVPIRYRPSSDLDSQSPDISIEEMDFEVEFIRLYVNGSEVTI
jgi:phage tail-like protein